MTDYRKHVFDYTAPTSPLREEMKEVDLEDVWLKGDGFGGGLSRTFAREQCYDFSHIRDSSETAMENMSAALTAMGYFPLDAQGQRARLLKTMQEFCRMGAGDDVVIMLPDEEGDGQPVVVSVELFHEMLTTK